jgi:hypothetical protein
MSIERIFYPAATMAAGYVSCLGGVEELQFRVMNLMRTNQPDMAGFTCVIQLNLRVVQLNLRLP